MKFLIVNDTHQKGTTPRCRRDDYPRTLCGKIAEVGYLAHKHDVDAVLHGGDMWDSYRPEPNVVATFLNAWHKALNGKRMLVVPGNHDELGQNPDLIHRTALGLGASLGYYELLTYEPVFFERDGLRVQVTGAPYHYEIDKRDPMLDYVPQVVEGDRLIHVAHGMLVREPLFPGAPYTPVSAIWDRTPADLTVSGHNHIGFPLVERGGRLFYNPGALVRTKADPRDWGRTVVVTLIEVTAGGIDLTDIPLESAPPAEEVLNPDIAPDPLDEERTAMLRALAEAVRRAGHRPGESILKFLERAAIEHDAAPEVVAEAKERLARALARAHARGEKASL